eukprot:TRINITY_DN1205_c1_g1_i2.p1 TRINITY_DN1205_c1_g1~~TRINITY_DN1205_c1_g1_i2.p1  ORF type:complete len:630 (+),score=48.50 TRINITY_DN1205_c1_g1_i2:175-2064(+)
MEISRPYWSSSLKSGRKNLCLISDCPFCKTAKTHRQIQVSLRNGVNKLHLPSVSNNCHKIMCQTKLGTRGGPPIYYMDELIATTCMPPLYSQCKEGFEPFPSTVFKDQIIQLFVELDNDKSTMLKQQNSMEYIKQYLENLLQSEEVELMSTYQTIQLQIYRDQFEQDIEATYKKQQDEKLLLEQELENHSNSLLQLQLYGESLVRERQQKESTRISEQFKQEMARIQKHQRKEKVEKQRQEKAQQKVLQKQLDREARKLNKSKLIAAAEEYEKVLEERIHNYMHSLLDMEQVVGYLTAQLDCQDTKNAASRVLNQNVQQTLWKVQEENISLNDELSSATIDASDQVRKCSQSCESIHMFKEESIMERLQLESYRNNVQNKILFLSQRWEECKKLRAQKREIGRINSIWEPEKNIMEQTGRIQPPMPPPPPPMRSKSSLLENVDTNDTEQVQQPTRNLRRALTSVKALKEGFEIVDTGSEEVIQQDKDLDIHSRIQVNQIKEGFEKSQAEIPPVKEEPFQPSSNLLVSSIRDGFEKQANADDARSQFKSIMKGFERSTTEQILSRNAVKMRRVHFENQVRDGNVKRNYSSTGVLQYDYKQRLTPKRSSRPDSRIDSDRWMDLVKFWRNDS